MLDTRDSLREALAQTSLANRPILAVPTVDSDTIAFALELETDEIEGAWKEARSVLDVTGRWPIVSTSWGSPSDSFTIRATDRTIFSRYGFGPPRNHSGGDPDLSPGAIIARSSSADPNVLLAELERQGDRRDDLDGWWEAELHGTLHHYEDVLDVKALEPPKFDSAYDMDRWLLDWEAAHGDRVTPESMRAEWYEADEPILYFLPTASGWDALAFMGWWGAEGRDAAEFIALGRVWEERYGAELVAHYRTMLQCLVSRPPTTIDEAWALGKEHDLVAPCNLYLPGLSLRHYARGLVGGDRWMLHERP